MLVDLMAREPRKKTMTERVQILSSERILEALDRWRAERQIWSRGDAVRRILEERLVADGVLTSEPN